MGLGTEEIRAKEISGEVFSKTFLHADAKRGIGGKKCVLGWKMESFLLLSLTISVFQTISVFFSSCNF